MFKLSNRGIYGVKALYELAKHFGDGPMSLRIISERHGIPLPFLVQVLHALKKKGIVRSVRGVNGGYILARTPGDITVGDAVRALEGPIALCGCLQNPTSADTKHRMRECVTSGIYKRLSAMVETAFDSITLAELAEEIHHDVTGDRCPD